MREDVGIKGEEIGADDHNITSVLWWPGLHYEKSWNNDLWSIPVTHQLEVIEAGVNWLLDL